MFTIASGYAAPPQYRRLASKGFLAPRQASTPMVHMHETWLAFLRAKEAQY